MKKIFVLMFSVFIVFGLLFGISAIADETTNEDEVTVEDLEVGEPNLLPNSPFYFLKEFWRQIRLTFVFNSIKKAELRLQFASEMLSEA